MKDYQVTYIVTVFVSSMNKIDAKHTARDLLESADSGWADCSLNYIEREVVELENTY